MNASLWLLAAGLVVLVALVAQDLLLASGTDRPSTRLARRLDIALIPAVGVLIALLLRRILAAA